jgi:uncharacterized protein (DUF433 family)
MCCKKVIGVTERIYFGFDQFNGSRFTVQKLLRWRNNDKSKWIEVSQYTGGCAATAGRVRF